MIRVISAMALIGVLVGCETLDSAVNAVSSLTADNLSTRVEETVEFPPMPAQLAPVRTGTSVVVARATNEDSEALSAVGEQLHLAFNTVAVNAQRFEVPPSEMVFEAWEEFEANMSGKVVEAAHQTAKEPQYWLAVQLVSLQISQDGDTIDLSRTRGEVDNSAEGGEKWLHFIDAGQVAKVTCRISLEMLRGTDKQPLLSATEAVELKLKGEDVDLLLEDWKVKSTKKAPDLNSGHVADVLQVASHELLVKTMPRIDLVLRRDQGLLAPAAQQE